jgi:hypothetical protein
VGLSDEIAQKVTTDILRSQFAKLLPPGNMLLPYDTLFALFNERLPPRLHIAVPAGMQLIDTSTFSKRAIFVLHSSADRLFADMLARSFKDLGVKVWLDDIDGDVSEPIFDTPNLFRTQIVVVLSDTSVDNIRVVTEFEMEAPRRGELTTEVSFPLSLDSAWKRARWSPLAHAGLARHEVFDFRGWTDPDKFRRLFQRLVTGLSS